MLDHFFNFTKKSNLIGRLYYDLTNFFDILVVAYFCGPPCRFMQLGIKFRCFQFTRLLSCRQYDSTIIEANV